MRDLVASAVAKAHAAHAAVSQGPAGSARSILRKAAPPTVRALNGALTLLPAMQDTVNAVRPGLAEPQAALHRLWMVWRTSHQAGWPLLMADALRLTAERSATALGSSTPALLHATRSCHPAGKALYLNQARAKHAGGGSELDAAHHLLHPPEEDLETGDITIFVESEGKATRRPCPTNRCMTGRG